MDLRRQIALVKAWLPLLIASVVLSAAAAFLVSTQLPKTYEARATLIVGQSLSGVNPDYTQLLASQRLSTTYASIATTRPNLDVVIRQLGLGMTSEELSKRVGAAAPLESTLLTITAQDADPSRAAAIANALADQVVAASPAIQGRQADLQKSIDAELKATQVQITAMQSEVDRLNGLASPRPADLTTLDTIQGRLITLRSTYASILSFSSGSAANLLSVVEPAVAPITPISPKPLLNTLVAAILGLLLAAGLLSALEYLDDKVKDPDAVQAVANLSTLGTITRIKGDSGRSEIYRLVTLLYPRSAAAEAFRTLRTNLEFASVDSSIRTLLVTSSAPGEGKTTTASNLAVVFAQAGRRVLLVDADLRKPGVHAVFDLPNSHGLTTLLRSDEVSLTAIVNGTEQANLRILTTGPIPPNPAELLGSQRMQTILERLKADADIVVFDSPPLQVVTDSAILGSLVDGTLFVVDADRSRRATVRLGREALSKTGATVLGAVINRIPVRNHSAYANYYGDDGSELRPEKRPRGPDTSHERVAP